MENEIKQEQTPQAEKHVENKPQPKAPILDKETQVLLEAENIKLKNTLSDLHYKSAGFDEEHREWVQTILEKEGKHLYDEKINDVLADKKYDIFRKPKNDTHSEHVANFGKQENKQQPLSEEEINNTQIYIPGIDGK